MSVTPETIFQAVRKTKPASLSGMPPVDRIPIFSDMGVSQIRWVTVTVGITPLVNCNMETTITATVMVLIRTVVERVRWPPHPLNKPAPDKDLPDPTTVTVLQMSASATRIARDTSSAVRYIAKGNTTQPAATPFIPAIESGNCLNSPETLHQIPPVVSQLGKIFKGCPCKILQIYFFVCTLSKGFLGQSNVVF